MAPIIIIEWNYLKFFLIAFCFILHLTCRDISNESTIRIKGSDTMLYLTKNLAEEYMKHKKGVSIYVEGGGTAAGIKSFVKGEINICTASRSLKGEEVKELAEHFGSVGVSFIIAKDALTVFVNPVNKVKDLSLTDIKNIFTGRIENWKEVGGKDFPINVIIRNPNSGTYLYFKEHVLNGEDYTSNAAVKPTTESIIQEIAASENSIGYGGIGYQLALTNVKVNGIAPTEENVQNGSYPIARYLYFYTHNTPSGTVKDFIDWVIGRDGQKIIKRAGFIPLWEY
jgi:phosphate transport system substrate-binding protein